MFKPIFAIGPAAGLLLALGALGACNQTYQADNSNGARREAHSTTAKVAKNAERAARDVTASATAVAKGIEKGVKEGVQQGQHDSQQAYNDQRRNSSTPARRTDRSSKD